jgi:hypothetical protein
MVQILPGVIRLETIRCIQAINTVDGMDWTNPLPFFRHPNYSGYILSVMTITVVWDLIGTDIPKEPDASVFRTEK